MSDVIRSTVPHLRFVFGGTCGGANTEIWACSLKLVSGPWLATPNTPGVWTTDAGILAPGILDNATSAVNAIVNTGGSGGPNLTDALAQHFVPAATALWQDCGRSDFNLTYFKLNAFGANDLQQNTITVESQIAPVPGGVATSVPWSTCTVIELRTSKRTRGPGSHGRIMFPAGMSLNQVTGQVANVGGTNPNNNAGLGILDSNYAIINFLADLNFDATTDALGDQWTPAIVYTYLPNHPYKSPGNRVATANPVDRAFWSTIPGQVRRRQNKLKQANTGDVVAYGSANAPA